MNCPAPTTPCIRGCTLRCRADECTAAGQHNHTPLPRPATHGRLCGRCNDNLHHWLVSIPDLYAELSTEKTFTADTSGSAHTKVSGSPALIRLDVLALLDPRTMTGPSQPGPTGIIEADDGMIDIAGSLTSWAALFMEEQNLRATTVDTITSALNVLTVWISTVVQQPWVDEMYTEVQHIHTVLLRATNAPRPIGRCFGFVANKPCNRPLYPSRDGGPVTCTDPKCGRTYDGLDLVKLELSERA